MDEGFNDNGCCFELRLGGNLLGVLLLMDFIG